MYNNEVNERIKAIRKERGYTQARFAELLDMSYDGYKKMERGDVKISIDKLVLLEKRLNISAEYIIFGEKPEFEKLWLKINSLNEKEKFCLLIRLYTYFTEIKKCSLIESDSLISIDNYMEKIIKEADEKGIIHGNDK